ncbi:MAG: glycine--tRNA ligase subunit beta, partial [Atribacterota bacterium]
DKMDTLVSSFALGRIPSGSFDPLGLRRMAQGIVDIIVHRRFYLGLSPWIELNLRLLEEQGFVHFVPSVLDQVRDFIFNRLRFRLLAEGVNYSVLNAVLADAVDDVYEVIGRAKFLDELLKKEKGFLGAIVTGFTRANNISRSFSGEGEIKPELLKEDVERELYQKLTQSESEFSRFIRHGKYREAFKNFSALLPTLNAFFDKVLVMCEDEELRRNRLLLMKKVVRMWEGFADLSLLVIESV